VGTLLTLDRVLILHTVYLWFQITITKKKYELKYLNFKLVLELGKFRLGAPSEYAFYVGLRSFLA